MHTLYYFIRWFVASLFEKIQGGIISECFSQEKGELVLRIETGVTSHWLRIQFNSEMALMAFPADFRRARKNSIDLFSEIIGQRIVTARTFRHDRSFELVLESGGHLEILLYGRNGNILYYPAPDQEPIFFKRGKNPNLVAQAADRDLDWSYEAFEKSGNPTALYFIFSKSIWKYLEANGYNSRPSFEKWQQITELHNQLLNLKVVFFTQSPPELSLVPVPGSTLVHDPLEAVNLFFQYWHQYKHKTSEQGAAVRTTTERIEQTKRYLKKTSQELAELQSANQYKEYADLIMANLHQIEAGVRSVQLDDFSTPGKRIEIPLKATLTPQKNAEVYYRKSRNQRIQIDKLNDQLTKRTTELKELELRLLALQSEEFDSRQKPQKVQKTQVEGLPYHEEVYDGFRILIGKNAQANDKLLQQYSFRDDLWLHARDVPGSHVLIKYQAGKNFPAHVISRAAALAAYYSKRKTESLCPVMVTQRKYVRKRKGDPAGAVVVEREKVVMAEPSALNSPA